MNRDNVRAYKEAAKKISAKLKDNISLTLDEGKSPDLYWKLEDAIVEAMRFAHRTGYEEARQFFNHLMKEFEQDDGSSSQ